MCAQNQSFSSYSRIEHVAKAFFFDRWSESLMGVFTGYFDVSGHPDGTDVLSVGGVVANAGQLARFEKEWKKVLADYGVSSLHMKHFAHSTGEYAAWKGDEGRRIAILSKLIAIIKARVRHSFVCSIYMPDYRAIDKVNGIRAVHSPFALAGCTCIRRMQNWATAKGFDPNKLVFAFEDGDADQSNFAQAARRDHGVNPVFMSKAQAVAFQAADLLAYEHLKANGKVVPASGVYAMEDLRHPLQALYAIPNGEGSEDWCLYEKPEITAGFRDLYAALDKPWVEP